MIKKVLAIILCLMLFISSMPLTVFGADKVSAKLIQMEGDVQIIRAGGEKPFKAFLNMRLTEGDKIITGSSGKAKVQMDDEVVITLAENTRIYLSELRGSNGAKQSSISLQSGGVGSSVKEKLKDNSRFEIKTPTAVMGVRGTEFFTQYYNGNVDVRVVDGVVEVTVNVSKEGDVTGVSGTGLKTYTFPIPALKQVAFSEGEAVKDLPDNVEDFDLDGLPVPFLDRVREINAVSPDSIPEDIMNTIDEAVKKAVNELKERLGSKDLVPDELAAALEGAIAGNIQQSAPTVKEPAPTTSETTRRDSYRDDEDDDDYQTLPKALFDVFYIDYETEEEIENPESITYFLSADWEGAEISLRIESEVPGIGYEVESSNEDVSKISEAIEGQTSQEASVWLEIIGAGMTTIKITGSATANGYEDYTRLITLIVEEEEGSDNVEVLYYASGMITSIEPDSVTYEKDIEDEYGRFLVPVDIVKFSFTETIGEEDLEMQAICSGGRWIIDTEEILEIFIDVIESISEFVNTFLAPNDIEREDLLLLLNNTITDNDRITVNYIGDNGNGFKISGSIILIRLSLLYNDDTHYLDTIIEFDVKIAEPGSLDEAEGIVRVSFAKEYYADIVVDQYGENAVNLKNSIENDVERWLLDFNNIQVSIDGFDYSFDESNNCQYISGNLELDLDGDTRRIEFNTILIPFVY